MDHDKRWNAAIEVLQEILMDNPEGRYRGTLREDKCCRETKEIKEMLLSYLKSLRR